MDCCDEIKTEVSLPKLNEPAPEFEAVTTAGTLKLSDYRGKWLILFSHPADFTPVCTTEFVAFSRLYPEFQKRNTELLGLSIDSNYSHIAWLQTIEKLFDVKVPFPVIADLDMKVSSLYGMVMPSASTTQAVRTVFFIDDKGIVRTMLYYPLNVGRNFDEIVRILDALQTADREKVALPADWRPGGKAIVPPPATFEGSKTRMNEGYECLDWFLCFRDL